MHRNQIVRQVLHRVPLAWKDPKTLLIEVWKAELGRKCFCPTHIRYYGSNPAGILRDFYRIKAEKPLRLNPEAD